MLRWKLVEGTARDRALGARVLSPIPGSPWRESPRNRRHPRQRRLRKPPPRMEGQATERLMSVQRLWRGGLRKRPALILLR